MKKINKFIKTVILFILLPCFAFAQPFDEAEIERLLNSANDAYTEGRYDKAYEIINITLSPYQQSRVIPENVKMMAEAVYYKRITQTEQTNDYNEFQLISKNLARYPQIVSDRITRKINKINSAHEKELTDKRAKALSHNRDKEWAYYDELLEEHKKSVADMTNSIKLGFSAANSAFAEQQEKNRMTAGIIKVILIVFAVILSCGAFVSVIALSVAAKRRRKDEEQFALTLKVVAALKVDNQEKLRLVSGGTLGIPAKPIEVTLLASDASNHIPSLSSADILEIKKYDEDFRKLGDRIDKYTLRRNNSRTVAEFVYKISRNLGASEELAIVYYYAGMVYDAGFLSISSDILKAEHLTVDQRLRIRDHVGMAEEYFAFIPQKYLSIFKDAAENHHENIDGSGYRNGLRENKIPDIARLIRVVESYISLISKRSYHAILDKDSAIEELKRVSGLYDKDILAALEEIV